MKRETVRRIKRQVGVPGNNRQGYRGERDHENIRLVHVLQRLTDAGNTVLVIEHNLDVIKVSDRIIDLGPEGGDGGGTVVAEGTPEQVAATAGSFTGEYLRRVLENPPKA